MLNPIHVTAKRLAAVVSPFTLNPSLNIVPAPINPIPDRSWAGILEASAPGYWLFKCSPQSIIRALLKPINAWVLNPAGLFTDCLSAPIIPARVKAKTNLIIVSNQNWLKRSFIKSICFPPNF